MRLAIVNTQPHNPHRLHHLIRTALLVMIAAAVPFNIAFPRGIGVTANYYPAIGWWHSFEVPPAFYPGGIPFGYAIGLQAGSFCAFQIEETKNPKPPLGGGKLLSVTDCDATHWFGSIIWGGVGSYSFGNPWNTEWTTRTGARIPIWPLSLLSASWLTLKIAKWSRTRNRRRNGLCLACSYDLRAHHPGANCPECGTLIPQLQRKPQQLIAATARLL